MPYVRVLRGGQITMPKEVRDGLEIKEGDILEVEMEKDRVVFKPKILMDKGKAWARLNQIIGKSNKRQHKIPEEEVERDALESIRTVRSKHR
jgi:AbrB family looped-hinge helix DNA binding protein